MKKCCTCKEFKAQEEFHKDNSSKDGFAYRCKACVKFHSSRCHAIKMKSDTFRATRRAKYINHKYGITAEEYEGKLASQNFACAICGVKLPKSGHRTHLDHCHKTGILRAFLCTNCNRGIGHFKESIDFLMEAVEYLKRHRKGVNR